MVKIIKIEKVTGTGKMIRTERESEIRIVTETETETDRTATEIKTETETVTETRTERIEIEKKTVIAAERGGARRLDESRSTTKPALKSAATMRTNEKDIEYHRVAVFHTCLLPIPCQFLLKLVNSGHM